MYKRVAIVGGYVILWLLKSYYYEAVEAYVKCTFSGRTSTEAEESVTHLANTLPSLKRMPLVSRRLYLVAIRQGYLR